MVEKMACADPPFNGIFSILAMFLAILLFFRALPTRTISMNPKSTPEIQPSTLVGKAPWADIIAPLQNQLEGLREMQVATVTELQRAIADNLQGLAKVASEFQELQRER